MTEPEPRPSASLLLLRDGADGIEVFMVLRHADIAQFGGALVFPGGCVGEEDGDPRWAACCRDGVSLEAVDRVRRIAAIREGFEESGVLLARDRHTEAFVDPGRMVALGQHRAAIDAGRESFLQLIEHENLELATDRLVPIGHWITPRVIRRRFDTVFYAARVPHALELRHDGREAVDSHWATAQSFLEAGEAGRHELIFPTRCNLLRVASYEQSAALLEAEVARPPVTVLPEPERDGDHVVLRIPEAAGYPICSERVALPAAARGA